MSHRVWTGDNLTRCKHCGAPIMVVLNEHGHRIPLDVATRPMYVVNGDHTLAACRNVTTAHHETCKGQPEVATASASAVNT